MMRETGFSMRPSYKRIPGFHVVKELPETMWAGFAYEMELMFLNPKSQTFGMNVTMEITKEDGAIGFGGFSLAGTLYTYDAPPREHGRLDINFNETSGGVFQFQDWIDERFNRLNLTVSLSPYVKPGTYTFTLTVTLQYKD